MTVSALQSGQAWRSWLRIGLLWGVAIGLFLLSGMASQEASRLSLIVAGSILGFFTLFLWVHDLQKKSRRKAVSKGLGAMVALGPHQQYLTDGDGAILASNAEGERISGGATDMIACLGASLADVEGITGRLLAAAAEKGATSEEFHTRDGKFSVHVAAVSPGIFQWQIHRHSYLTNSEGAGIPRLPMLTVSAKGAVLFMNAAARELLGARRTALREIFGDDGPRQGEANTIMTEDGGKKCLVAEFPTSAGRREIYLLPTTAPRIPGDVVLFEDLPIALLKIAVDGRVVSANRAARALVKRDFRQTVELQGLMEGLGRSINDWLSEAAAGHGGNHSEFLLLRREDREVFVQVSLNRVVEGDHIFLIAVLSDATELKSLEAQFVQSQKMQAIGQLAGGVAHDFNNLLTAISGHCDLMLLRHDEGDPDFGDLVQINQNANRAAALVGQLLAFSRKQNLRPEVLDLHDTLADLTHLLNRLVGEKVRLTLMHDPELSAIRADKRQLEQVLMNLVVNARDAMPKGGEIVIQTEGLRLDKPLTRDRATVPAGKYVCVRVRDEGVGIPGDKLQKVFEPFFSTKRTGEGTGLGLSTAYGIVKQTGGYIFVDSTLGEGTQFTLMFPEHDLYEVPKQEIEAERQAAQLRPQGGVVLLVEDEAPVRSFASRALRLRGLTVLEAGTGEEALETLEDADLHVDLFVTDVVMPGMDGPSWVQKARQRRPEVKVVFMSGYAEDSFSDRQAKIANSTFLPKPFSLNDLTGIVMENLGEAQEIPA